MKKKIVMLLAVAAVVAGLCGCSGKDSGKTADKKDNKLKIVATIFPEYDWLREIIGDNTDNTDLTLLLENGVDMHSFQPTARDILKISDCDVVVYVGGESDAWMEDALAEAANKDMKKVRLFDLMGETVKEEEVKEGMEAESECAVDEETEYDEHVWLSLKNAELFCNSLEECLSELDPDNAEAYKANTEAYVNRLKELDAGYEKAAEESDNNTLLFADRFPFRYLVDDYGLAYYAAFPGCSAETEASFSTIAFLADKIDELGLKSVLVLEKSDDRVAKTVIENTKTKDQQILQLDSMQSVTAKDIENNVTYLSVMKDNLEVLEKALK